MKKSLLLFLILAFLAGLLAGWYFWSRRGEPKGVPPGLSAESARSFARKLLDLASTPDHPRTLEISETEINSFLHFDFAQVVPPGVREAEVKILNGSALARGRINFEELPLEKGGGNNPLIRILLKGEHDLAVTGALSCQAGKGHFEIREARFDQGEIPKPLLALIIARLLRSKVPGLNKDRTFDLPPHIEGIDLKEGKVKFHLIPPPKPSN
jgi:hypothetical protein